MFKKVAVRIVLVFVILAAFGVCISYATYLTLKRKQLIITEIPKLPSEYKIEENTADITRIKQELITCSNEVQRILEIVHSMNKQKAMAENYSRILLLLANIETSIVNNRNADISTDVAALINIAAMDFNVREIVKEIDGFSNVYGRKYFEQTFGEIARKIIVKHYSNPNDGKIVSGLKRYFFGSFVYLTPSGNEINRALYEARTQLQSGDMKGLYSSLKTLNIQTEKGEIFLTRLENYNKVMQTVERTRKYIEYLTVESKISSEITPTKDKK